MTILEWPKYTPDRHRIRKIARTIADLDGGGSAHGGMRFAFPPYGLAPEELAAILRLAL